MSRASFAAVAGCLFLLIAAASSAQTREPEPRPEPAAAPAEPAEPQYPVIRIGALSYFQYDAELENRDGYNAFDVTRTYLNVTAQVAPRLRFRFTPDIKRATDGPLAGSLVLRVKYAFAQIDRVTPRGWVRVGMHQTPWLDFEEGINRYRVQGTMFAEREGLIPGSADVGASYFTSVPGGYGEIHAGIYNGEGHAQPEANKYKSVQVRGTVRPFPNRGLASGIRISGFVNQGWYSADRPRRLGIVMGSYEHAHLVATIEHVSATENPAPSTMDIERRGWSIFVEPRQGVAGLAGIVRYDVYDPDDATAGDDRRRMIAGGAYWFAWPRARVGLVATSERVNYAADERPDEHRILVQTHVEF